jgi:uroporphyrinogen III methyltransferase/synthase
MKNQKPFAGKTIVITRARSQASEFSRLLTDLGAEVIEFPTIEIIPPDSWAPLDEAIENLRTYDWIVFTSANGVRFFVSRLQDRGQDIVELKGVQVCAIGPGTAEQLKGANIEVRLVPSEYRAEAVVEGLKRKGLMGKRVLLARAKAARDVLPRELANQGALVDVVPVYQTVRPKSETSEFLRLLGEGRINAIAFTSSSTVSNFLEMFGSKREELLKTLQHVVIAAIGPITRDRAIELGLAVHISPVEYTIPALTEAMAKHFSSER